MKNPSKIIYTWKIDWIESRGGEKIDGQINLNTKLN
jgi:hypothetical protein